LARPKEIQAGDSRTCQNETEGPMNLEYLTGYTVEAVSIPLKKTDWEWALLLEGDVRVEVTDKRAKKPSNEIENTIIGVVHAPTDGPYTLDFYSGTPAAPVASCNIPRDGYRVVGMEFPQREDAEATRPDDPSELRVVDGSVEVT
jgi:hypothetical protein